MGKKSTVTFEQALEDVGLTAKWEAWGRAEGEEHSSGKVACVIHS